MAKFVAFIVYPDVIMGERHEIVNMQGRHLKDRGDARRWLLVEVPRSRPDLAGLRIDVIDLDEPLDAH